MKIIMISNFKTFFIVVAFCSSLFSSDFESQISKILKDSLDINSINMEELKASYSTDPNFLFMTALIDSNGDTALEKFKKGNSKKENPKKNIRDIKVVCIRPGDKTHPLEEHIFFDAEKFVALREFHQEYPEHAGMD